MTYDCWHDRYNKTNKMTCISSVCILWIQNLVRLVKNVLVNTHTRGAFGFVTWNECIYFVENKVPNKSRNDVIWQNIFSGLTCVSYMFIYVRCVNVSYILCVTYCQWVLSNFGDGTSYVLRLTSRIHTPKICFIQAGANFSRFIFIIH